MIDKQKVASSFGKAATSYERAANAQSKIAKQLASLISECKLEHGCRVLEVGCGTGLLSKELAQLLKPSYYLHNDISASMATQLVLKANSSFICGDAEQTEFAGSYHLIASSSALQWFAKPQQFIRRMEQQLVAGGVIAISTFGKTNLQEIACLTGRQPLSYPSLDECSEYVSSQMQIMALKSQQLVMQFASPQQALQHLKACGVNGGIAAQNLSASAMRNLLKRYQLEFSHPNGGVTLTYNPIYLVAVKK